MNELDDKAFNALFKEAFEKCFAHPLSGPLTETESKQFYNKIFDQTGLVVGWKSLKNYSFFLMNGSGSKTENPSVATMDTLARYVLDAPYLSEIERKEKESHYPYWFEYKEKFHRSLKTAAIPELITPAPSKKKPFFRRLPVFTCMVAAAVFVFWFLKRPSHYQTITEEFHDVSMAALVSNGWLAQNPDTLFWNKRNEKANCLTLYTLRGDTWPNAKEKLIVRNLVLREIPGPCFSVEVHLSDFLPDQNWQQAGILLMEDTNFTGKILRLSIAYNDFFGGYNKPKEMIIQAITSLGKTDGEPEEIAHQPILFLDSARQNKALFQNVTNMSLRIEKTGNQFRFLYAGGAMTNPAFREIETHHFDIHPKWVGLFAIKGFVDHASEIPVRINFFRLTENSCE